MLGTIFLVMSIGVRYVTKQNFSCPFGIKLGMEICATIGIIIFLVLFGKILLSGTKQGNSQADYMIVLGAKVNGTTITRALKYRLDEALEYAKQYPNTKIIVSGGKGEGEKITEAQAMFQYLTEHGMEPEKIIKEDISTNTYQNIENSKKLMKNTDESIIVVTNNFHLYRAIEIAKKQGLKNVDGIAAPTDSVLWMHYHMREVFAVLKYKITGDI